MFHESFWPADFVTSFLNLLVNSSSDKRLEPSEMKIGCDKNYARVTWSIS
jgi:hypothetical protein